MRAPPVARACDDDSLRSPTDWSQPHRAARPARRPGDRARAQPLLPTLRVVPRPRGGGELERLDLRKLRAAHAHACSLGDAVCEGPAEGVVAEGRSATSPL